MPVPKFDERLTVGVKKPCALSTVGSGKRK